MEKLDLTCFTFSFRNGHRFSDIPGRKYTRNSGDIHED